jgi:SAM-dependent methyltransferase
LLRLAVDLGAAGFGGPLSSAENALIAVAQTGPPADTDLSAVRCAIEAGGDPLGDELMRIRPAPERRAAGAFYTPSSIVEPMVTWALDRHPVRVVDAGCGSGRFAAAVARHDTDVAIVAVDLDPLATLLARATLFVLRARNARVVQGDYTALMLDQIKGRTAFIGNPPYVRHHELPPPMKAWAADAGRRLGYPVSSLAGLHAYFFLATALMARPGDVGTFITSSEWLDVGYGSVIRQLLLDGLGGLGLTAFHPNSTAFADVMTTAVIVSFKAGAHPDSLHLRQVSSVEEIPSAGVGHEVRRELLATTDRWSTLLRTARTDGKLDAIPVATPIRLREIARVHRGQVTGGNSFFVMTREQARERGLDRWCRPVITSAEEVLDAGGIVRDSPERKVLLCVPKDIDRNAHPTLDRYLSQGEQRADPAQPALFERYVPRHRSPWWHLGKIPAPPVIASYMARRAPAFALNPDRLALLNIGHGLWPVADLTEADLADLVEHLNAARSGFIGEGRTYHGGLEKFEPGEMENLVIPEGHRWRP